uniref:Probable arginine--tRNA ligase, mitochondrial n=1 Tax=Sinocyclocheilus rhinocerous TaxID=307959 RepID=A0A673H2A2_9TELE
NDDCFLPPHLSTYDHSKDLLLLPFHCDLFLIKVCLDVSHTLCFLQKLLEQLRSDPDGFGVKSEFLRLLQGGRTLVEFSSPNIAKKFHAEHLRSTIIGNFIANLKKALGKEVIRVNYLGAWGMQFASLLSSFCVYVQVNREAERDESVRSAAAEFFRRLERREEQALALWRQFREITVDEYKRIYQRLGVDFDHYSGEAFHQSQTQSVLDELTTTGLLKTTEKGTAVVDLSGAGDMSSYATLVRSDGTSLYITRDVAAALDRKQRFGFDEMIYVTDKSQTGHFQQLFHILRAMGHQWAERCVHVAFGLVQGMSTRRGEVVFLEDVLEEARSRMLNNMRQSSKDMRVRRTPAVTVSPLVDSRSVSVLQHLLIRRVFKRVSGLMQMFLCVFSHLVSSAHRELPVKGSAAAVAQARLCLFSAVRSVLANGMRILGITLVEKM